MKTVLSGGLQAPLDQATGSEIPHHSVNLTMSAGMQRRRVSSITNQDMAIVSFELFMLLCSLVEFSWLESSRVVHSLAPMKVYW